MLISEKWLREWVNPALETEALAHQITMAGLEVDGIEAAVANFSGVVVAEIVSFEKHPDADSLNVCQVFNGVETVQIVCGAPNVRSGMKAPLAQINAVLPGDFKIKKARLRGVESFGMLCGASEIGLEDLIDGLLELPADAPVGVDIRDYLYLDDRLIEVDLTPNRADCLSIRGIAREVASLNDLTLDEPVIDAVLPSIQEQVSIVLDNPDACPRYLGRVIVGVDVSCPSPLWLVEKLRRAGVRSVDVVVDVTNLVMLELGQPMHAFDKDRLQGAIHARLAAKGETLELLNGQTVELDDTTLVIADDHKALAIAGVMGGKASSVTTATQNILLESAFFAPLAVAGRARRYGLHTDASHRFERGVDWQLQAAAIERATQLILALAGGQAGPVIEAKSDADLPCTPPVSLAVRQVNQLLALSLDEKTVATLLERLGFVLTEQSSGQWLVDAPSWRFDIEREEDLIEEVARLYGYDRLPRRLPANAPQLALHPETVISPRRQADLLVDRGYQEAICYSFVEPTQLEKLTPGQSSPQLLNPISADLSAMRTTLWAGLLGAAKYNTNRQVTSLRLFEQGLRFVEQDGELIQQRMIAGLCFGQAENQQWQGKARQVDFYDLKGDVEALLSLSRKGDVCRFVAAEHPALHPGQTAAVFLSDRQVGVLGKIHPQIARQFGVSAETFLFELDDEATGQSRLPVFAALSDQPAVRRDLALVVDASVAAADVIAVMRRAGPDSLRSVELFDVYQGENLDVGHKSLALALSFQHPEETLKEVAINGWIDRIVLELKQEFNAHLRDA